VRARGRGCAFVPGGEGRVAVKALTCKEDRHNPRVFSQREFRGEILKANPHTWKTQKQKKTKVQQGKEKLDGVTQFIWAVACPNGNRGGGKLKKRGSKREFFKLESRVIRSRTN